MVIAAVVFVAPALADSPADVYSDFATDGKLDCGHSRSALSGVLNDASLYQYGDPLTFVQLKLAIRRQLARGCRRARASAAGVATSGEGAPPTGAGIPEETQSQAAEKRARRAERPTPAVQNEPNVGGSDAVQRSGGMTMVGIGLLLLALGSGAWAAKRAFKS